MENRELGGFCSFFKFEERNQESHGLATEELINRLISGKRNIAASGSPTLPEMQRLPPGIF